MSAVITRLSCVLLVADCCISQRQSKQLTCYRDRVSDSGGMSSRLIAVDFEVFGRVQGVFFRKCTREKATQLQLYGWCRNTEQGTVQGHLQGDSHAVSQMTHWLQKVGSPKSSIERAHFCNEKQLNQLEMSDFTIRR